MASARPYAIDAAHPGSVVKLGRAGAPSGEIIIAGAIRAYSGIELFAGTSPAGTSAVTFTTSALIETLSGSMHFAPTGAALLNAEFIARGAGSDITVTNSAIRENAATTGNGGGANIAAGSFVSISSTTISGNTAVNSSGGLFITRGTVSNVTISGNTANGTAANGGGGVRIQAGVNMVSFISCTITNNSAPNAATGARSGIWHETGTVNLSNTIVAANIADHDAEDRATLEEAGIYTTAASKAVRSGIDKVIERLKPAEDGRPRLFIVRDCLVERDERLVAAKKPWCTAQEIDGYVWPKGKPGKNEDENPVKENDHGMDPKRYIVVYRDGMGEFGL